MMMMMMMMMMMTSLFFKKQEGVDKQVHGVMLCYEKNRISSSGKQGKTSVSCITFTWYSS